MNESGSVIQGRRKTTKGYRMAGRKDWGYLRDGRSRLSQLRKKIELDIVESITATPIAADRQERAAQLMRLAKQLPPLQRRRIRRAAELMALAEQGIALLGVDVKITRRSITALQMTAQRELAALSASRNGKDQDHGSMLADLLEQAPR